ncbi:MAG: glycosyltransferase family 4 protein [bacterium]|nr:glycosyltransferase family 4 protein [bacterium]
MSEPLRLLQLVHGYPPAIGGVERAVCDLCEWLVRERGAEVTVLTTNAYTNANFHDGSLPTVPIERGERRNGVAVHRFPAATRWTLPLRVAQKAAYELHLPGNDWLRTWYQGPISSGLRLAARAADPDVVCAASFPLNHLFYAFPRGRPGPPVVLLGSIHTEDRWGYERRNLMALTRRAWATVAHTEPEAAWLIERGAPAGRVVVIPEGIDEKAPPVDQGAFRRRRRIPDGAFLAAYVGQQGSHKGIDVLLKSLPALLEREPSARLVIAGARTPYTPAVRRTVAELQPAAQERVCVLDDLDEQGKSELLADCDVFVSPSRYESFGITTLEAWRRGKPVVVGDGPAPRWVLGGGATGLLVPYGDRDALVAALARLAVHPELRRELGEAGRQRFLQQFTTQRISEQYYQLFLSAKAHRANMST